VNIPTSPSFYVSGLTKVLKRSTIMSEGREESIKIYCLAEDKFFRLTKQKKDLEDQISELKKQLD